MVYLWKVVIIFLDRVLRIDRFLNLDLENEEWIGNLVEKYELNKE